MQELSLHVLDLVQNAVEAGADEIEIEIKEDWERDRLTITVSDNGRGMTPQQATRLTDPFYTTRQSRQVGLGVPLLAAAAEAAGGGVQVTSRPGQGTSVMATFGLSHLDRAPLGDMGATIQAALVGRPALQLSYRHGTGRGSFELDLRELRARLGEVAPDQPVVANWIRQYVRAGLAEMGSRA